MSDYNKDFDFEDKVIADDVADQILTVSDDKENRWYFLLIVLFLFLLIFLVSTLSFAIFDTYYNGGSKNVIDVNVNVDVDDDDDKDDDKDKEKDDDDSNKDKDRNNNKRDDNGGFFKPDKPDSVFFSYNEKSNYINMVNVFPTLDSVGKALSGNKQFFDFNISAISGDNKKRKLVYEISLVPSADNTIKQKDIRVYLTENGSGVSLTNDLVRNFNELPLSKHNNGRVIYKKTVNNKYTGDYVFRMWLSSDANIDKVSKKFACKVVVNAYYK